MRSLALPNKDQVPVALADLEGRVEHSEKEKGRPFNGHDALRVATEIFKGGFAAGSNVYSTDGVAEALDALGDRAILHRGQNLADFMGSTDVEANKAGLRAMFRGLAYDRDGGKVSVEVFAEKGRNIFGAVLTGHPVFGKSEETSNKLAKYFTLVASGRRDKQAWQMIEDAKQELLASNREPFTPLTLDDESDYSVNILANMHEALAAVELAFIDVAQEEYPDDWEKIDYMPVTLATWIPFDWDGRTDITWNKALEKRLVLIKTMLEQDISIRLNTLQNTLDDQRHKETLGNMRDNIAETVDMLEKDIDFLRTYNPDADRDFSRLSEWERKTERERAARINHPDALIVPLQKILDEGTNPDATKMLVHMRSRLRNHGITYAQIHTRSNAQVTETHMFQKFGVENLQPSEVDALLFNQVDDFLSRVESMRDRHSESSNISYIEIAKAKNIPYRNAALLNKYGDYDSHSPSRRLNAEARNAAVLLFDLAISMAAKVENRVRTCPLTEDKAGVDLFKGTVARLYGAADYLGHMVRTGEACFQLGYSDSAKEAGQIAAGNAMDHVAHKIVKEHHEKIVVPHEQGKGRNADCVIFFTHGESPGRGGLPTSITERMAYLCTPHLLNYANEKNVKLKTEESFQGGDGFLLHGSVEASLAYFTQALSYLTADHRDAANDIYYRMGDAKDDINRFFMEGSREHMKLSSSLDQKEMISHFKGSNPKTGSRPDKREGSGIEGQIRAIPYNEEFLQLGVQVPVYYGYGELAGERLERYGNLRNDSAEFFRRLSMIESTIGTDDPAVMDAYVKLYNPDFWEDMSEETADISKKNTYRKVADYMASFGHYEKYSKVVKRVYRDHEDMKEVLARWLFQQGTAQSDARNAQAKHEKNLVHCFKLASMMKLFEIAVTLPELAPGEVASRDAIIRDIKHFNPRGIAVLKEIFEASTNGSGTTGARSLLQEVLQPDYSELHRTKIGPMEDMMGFIKNKASPIIMDLNGRVG